jgi:hypothetical protein
MSLNQLRAVLAPSLASLLLILCICSFVPRRPSASGIHLHLYPLHPENNLSGVCNTRAIVLWLTRDGRMWINETEVSPAQIRPKLEEVFEYRTVRRAYAVVDSGVPYGQFADFFARIASVTPKLDFVLLSGDLRRKVEREPTFEGLCDLSSPESELMRPFAVYLSKRPAK